MDGDIGTYVIERLISRRQFRRGKGQCTEYLVRWQGYGPEYDTWYNIKDLDDAKELITECDQQYLASGISTAVAVVIPKRTS